MVSKTNMQTSQVSHGGGDRGRWLPPRDHRVVVRGGPGTFLRAPAPLPPRANPQACFPVGREESWILPRARRGRRCQSGRGYGRSGESRTRGVDGRDGSCKRPWLALGRRTWTGVGNVPFCGSRAPFNRELLDVSSSVPGFGVRLVCRCCSV